MTTQAQLTVSLSDEQTAALDRELLRALQTAALSQDFMTAQAIVQRLGIQTVIAWVQTQNLVSKQTFQGG